MPPLTFQNPQFLRATWTARDIDAATPIAIFAGRSNAGKSSVLNALCGGRFARTARLPGRTRMINLFALKHGQLLADLPGYGYAAVSKQEQQAWSGKLIHFLKTTPCLCGVVLVVDCRRGLQEKDIALLHTTAHLPTLVLMNKADKLRQAMLQNCLKTARATLATLPIASTVLPFSALKKSGLTELRRGVTDLFLGKTPLDANEDNTDEQ